jgi:hypothetical protein
MTTMMNYQKINIFTGWFTWAIATIVYVLTIEPTASFWDCGEFIATAFKLEVGHPPGAPLFMLIGRFFTLFSSPENAAMMVNLQSALSSSFTILFLFWSITALTKKIALINNSELNTGKIIAIMGSGLVGGLAYTFSDSFWFSAVEGEVYAMSSFFTAIVFWAILKWEAEVDHDKYANRWLILIAYLMGLSIGVHLLNLLAIPAIVFVYYYKNYTVTRNGFIKAGIISILILGAIQYGIIPWTVIFASYFELFFTNTLGMPFNTGAYIYLFLVGGALIYGIYHTHKNNQVIANTIIMSITVILIGYSTFGVILIRSNANTPMDENNPENVFNLLSYLNREQYGDRPLAYGHFFDSPIDNTNPYLDGKPVYFQDKASGKYIISDDKKASIPNYASEFNMVFPRMYSSEGRHKRAYKQWSNFKGKPKKYRTISGETKTIYKPTFSENIRFFLTYQVGWMYARYFMWNFAGRQNDIQGHGDMLDGNWISGINFIDDMRIGKQSTLPDSLKNNPGRNTFFLLPLILGLIGLYFQFSKDKNNGFIVFLLFFFTGLAIVIYLNQYPYQPRERDYAYAGSFYAFAMWIGIGVYALYDMLRKALSSTVSATVSTAVCLTIPGVMAAEGWDDHSRANTYTARDFAKNYLDSCAPNAILFTNGDNDTFPLWYVQEVEEYRTDVRVVNLSLLNTDWYVDQMRIKAYDSDPIPFSIAPEKYRQGTRDYLPVINKNKQGIYVDVKDVVNFISDDKNAVMFSSDRKMNYFPTDKFSLKVDSATVVNNGTVPKGYEDRILPAIEWSIKKSYIMKNDMMILDLLANNNWERPIYFAITTGDDSYIGLQEYFQLEGLAYRLVPFKSTNKDGQTGEVNTDIMYNNLVKKFLWGGMDEHHIYLNENNRRMCMNLRNNFARLADALVKKGEKEKAIETLDRCMEVMPEHNVPFNFFMLPVAESYYKAGAFEKANEIVSKLAEIYEGELNYYFSLQPHFYTTIEKQVQQGLSVMYRLVMLTNQTYKQEELGSNLQDKFNALQQVYASKGSYGVQEEEEYYEEE